ncbi:hypothetical protein RHSIM_Rhsim08G0109800 [Rhododendron simsii]|uniref:Reverse transcriptase domain-containing protein n=1 Tax=Rhododendron simsii TaxID=118357 RepID=A0A834GJZ0_RHOSS|nr:hypothetical protein RHSIM_Rhsim08G0109800 [Rhododendron simsii]
MELPERSIAIEVNVKAHEEEGSDREDGLPQSQSQAGTRPQGPRHLVHLACDCNPSPFPCPCCVRVIILVIAIQLPEFSSTPGRAVGELQDKVFALVNSDSGPPAGMGSWLSDPQEVHSEFRRHFTTLFSANPSIQVQETVEAIPSKLTDDMNRSLTRSVTDLEIHTALMDMGPSKAPGVDGMTALFYHSYWSTVGEDVVAAVKSFFHSSHLLRSVNQTLITLIPKVSCPTTPGQFRPISLCNVSYKLITKILANRLRDILPSIISENQSAFVGGRQISDSILIAHEIMHSLKNRRNGRKGWVALKLDMAKAFDRIEWSYLEAVLRKFGFNETWIRWVMSCVTTVSFATLINGEKGELFTPSRGIRQGCPLSPYLFILCAEGFHCLIQRAIMNSSLNGVKIGQHCLSISHLFFADDLLLFWEATSFGCYAIDEILRKYEIASGQMVNREKSSLFFSPNTPADVKQGISEALNIRFENHGGKYLGLPSIIGRSKTGVFQYVKDRVIAKLKSRNDTVLNLAGKETMLKSVAMTMPNFIMQCFLLPKRVCKDLCSVIRKFWWGSKEGENKISWVNWNKLCDSKLQGGLGFWDFHDFNIAFLAKQGWRLVNGPESLFQRLFKGKYFHYSTFWDASCPKSASWAWRSICAGRTTLRKGWRWCVGDGKAISIWRDPWLPRSLSFRVLSPPPPVDSLYHSVTRVSDLIDEFQSNKRIMEGSIFGFRKAEPSQQQPMVTPPLDMRRAQLSRQHEKFNDVVSWLRAKASCNGESFSALGSHTAPNNLVLESKENQIKSSKEETDFARPSTTAVFAPSWGSGALFSSQSPFAFGNQISAPLNNDASNEGDDEDLQQPSSPSVKKTEEKGVSVVHEVKCKLYVKSSDPADKDAWKDKGTGQLSIRCKEGVSKCTRESKPTVLVRNDVGKILLNALLYPGIKTSLQKNSIVAIFHTTPDSGNDGGNSNGVVARTFLIRTKTEEDRNKLAAVIQEYTPAA